MKNEPVKRQQLRLRERNRIDNIIKENNLFKAKFEQLEI